MVTQDTEQDDVSTNSPAVEGAAVQAGTAGVVARSLADYAVRVLLRLTPLAAR